MFILGWITFVAICLGIAAMGAAALYDGRAPMPDPRDRA